MKAYRLMVIKDESIIDSRVINELDDVDCDFTSKKEYIKSAKIFTKVVNKKFNLHYTFNELFGYPVYLGWCYCKKHNHYYWESDECEFCDLERN